jgi:ferrochelatase
VQVQATAARVAAWLPELGDWRVTFQSRVGPLKWLTPSTVDEISRAGAEGRGVIVCPISFVSEHVETLVELDHEYAEVARRAGCAPYLRSAAPGVRAPFIAELAQAALIAQARSGDLAPHGAWLCPVGLEKCPCEREHR